MQRASIGESRAEGRIARALLALLAGCAPSPDALNPAAPAPSASSATVVVSAKPSATPPVAEPSASPEVEILPFVRVLDAPVHSIAFGKKRKAALGKDAWMDQGKGWVKLPAPSNDATGMQIFFGRDDQPRLMGSAAGPKGPQRVYLRWKDAGWRLADYELGKMATGPSSPLFGVLGHADPEVVCKQGGDCLVKRLTGWTDIDGLAGTPFVELCGAVTWAYQGREVWRLEPKGWRRLTAEPSFERADGLWSIGETDVWVAERAKNAVHHFDGSTWTRQASPIAGPRSLWASSAGDVWLVGDGGAAHHDGKAWRRAKAPPVSLTIVSGRSADDVWLAGGSGLWHGTRGSTP